MDSGKEIFSTPRFLDISSAGNYSSNGTADEIQYMSKKSGFTKKNIPDSFPGEVRGEALRTPRTGIVIPCYNETEHLEAEPFQVFVTENPHIHFRFVNDKSTDNTQQKIEEIARGFEKNITFQLLPENCGKGEAVRAGVHALLESSRFEYIGYWDADLATPLEEIPRLIKTTELRPSVQFVCGSRIQRMGAQIKRYWYRHYFGRVFATAASLVLGLPIYDTQNGAKLISAEIAKEIFNQPFISRWLFDIELLARLIQIQGRDKVKNTVFELPLERWEDKRDSKVKISYIPKVPFELCRIRFTYRKSLREK